MKLTYKQEELKKRVRLLNEKYLEGGYGAGALEDEIEEYVADNFGREAFDLVSTLISDAVVVGGLLSEESVLLCCT